MNTRSEWIESGSTSFNQLFYTKEETINSVIENFDYRRNYSAEGYSVIIDEVVEQVIIQDHSNPINESDVDKKLLVPMSSLAKTGDYVIYRNSTWMINSNVNIISDAYKACQMQYCNCVLKFQNPQGTILSYPCIDSNSTGNESENKIITVGNITKTITIPCDENTILLSNGKRFFIDRNIVNPRAYEIIGVDSTSKSYGDKGLIILTVRECVGQEDDRIDLGVCNYVEVVVEPVVPDGNTYSTILCNNPDNELIVGSTIYRTLTPSFYNADKTIATGIIPVWEFIHPIGFESDFIVVYDGNQAKIKVNENYDLLGKTISVKVSNGVGQFTGNLELTITV